MELRVHVKFVFLQKRNWDEVETTVLSDIQKQRSLVHLNLIVGYRSTRIFCRWLSSIRLRVHECWKATMEYHRTKDILYVKQLLGHRNINSTLVYTQLVSFENPEEYTCRAANTLKEDKELIEAGFEYDTERDGVKIYRKRK